APEPMALAKALASVRKTPLQDQIFIAKGSWGIVAENLTAESADALTQSLAQAGVECKSVRSASIPALPKAAEFASRSKLPHKKPNLVSSADITITSTTTKTVKEGPSATQKIVSTGILLTTGLPIRIGGKERTVEKTQHQSDQVFYLDLLYPNPLRRFRA